MTGKVVYGSTHGQWTESINLTADTILVDGHKLTAPREGHYRVTYNTLISSSATVNVRLFKNNALGLNRQLISETAYHINNIELTLSLTDVLFMETGSFIFVEMNVTNGFLLVPSGTWVILEEL